MFENSGLSDNQLCADTLESVFKSSYIVIENEINYIKEKIDNNPLRVLVNPVVFITNT